MVIKAPYNFVPLAEDVVFPDWANRVSHDVPFEDGVSGVLELELEAHTPVCVGSTQGQDKVIRPFQLPGGIFAIPGSSIKGMLRNVLEIVSFSKMGLVDRDRRFAVRDLSGGGRFYRDQLTKPVGNNTYRSLARTGWLYQDEHGWYIVPCKMSRVERSDLLNYCPSERHDELERCFNAYKIPSKNKYVAWGEDRLEISFTPGPEEEHRMSNNKGNLRFSLAGDLGHGSTRGTLVFTGQPSPNKHREFIFYGETAGERFEVPKDVRWNFILNHSNERGERHAGGDPDPNEEWGYWKGKLNQGNRVPVFYLLDSEGKVDSLGLAQMYRLAYKLSIGQAIDNTSKNHGPDSSKLDMADLVFGQVAAGTKGSTLKGRAQVGIFVAEGKVKTTGVIKGVLSSPKPTYYPNYISQEGAGRDYKTLMDRDAKIRGWKRYPVRNSSVTPPGPGSDQQRVTSKWICVEKGTAFEGRIVVHNLRPVELGALLWTIDFGGSKNLCHSLGKAKPFGFGAVRLRLKGTDLYKVNGMKPCDESVAQDSIQAFESYMEGKVKSWKGSPQLRELLEMADPQKGDERSGLLKYMVIGKGKGKNEFQEAKNKYNREILPLYSQLGSGRPQRIGGGAANRGGGQGRGYRDRNDSRAQQQVSSSAPVKAGNVVEAVLLQEKTKKGGWKAEYKGLKGPIAQSDRIPGDAKPGDKIKLVVAFSKKNEIHFKGPE